MVRLSSAPILAGLALFLPVCAWAQPAPTPVAAPSQAPQALSPLRTLIISGGPDREYTQYAIESNARYLESLVARGQSLRVLFTDGKRASHTISTLETGPNFKAAMVLAWLLDEAMPASRVVLRASTLKRIDGAANKPTILKEVAALEHTLKPGEQGFVYFTGHGSPGHGWFGREDHRNNVYNAWYSDLSVRELAPTLQKWPTDVPLVLMMVQCYSGGFANLLFEGGNPYQPIWSRDFCGFFAATDDRMASGCTTEVNERDYQDFTTHFLAALSGKSRAGDKVTGADYDHNGNVSMLEAFAWANAHDHSIDVPICTSDFYLRHALNEQTENWGGQKWTKTSFSSLMADAQPWQKAILQELSTQLHLSGENRLQAALEAHRKLQLSLKLAEIKGYDRQRDDEELDTSYSDTHRALLKRFPALKHLGARQFAASKRAALRWLVSQPKTVELLYQGEMKNLGTDESADAQEAMLWRFVRCAHTITLQKRLQTLGTAQQKAVFVRLRQSEGRNPLNGLKPL